jgi:uncharacterized membrane protein YraQ (UPF0718 family)
LFGSFRDLGGVAACGRDRHAALATAGTVFCGVFVQALPFLGLGVLVSGLIAVFVPPERLVRWLPRRSATAVLAAGLAGAALPGCECGSVPVARRLFGEGGAAGAAALTFMLAAPAINPVVVVATAVAFPGQPKVVVARVGASLLTAVVMGWLWSRWGRADWITRRPAPHPPVSESKWLVFCEVARQDFLQAAAYLVVVRPPRPRCTFWCRLKFSSTWVRTYFLASPLWPRWR